MQYRAKSLALTTQRLRLKPILENGLDTLDQILVNPYVSKYLCDDQVFSLAQVKDMVLESEKLFNENGFGLWFIETKKAQEMIGFVGLWYFFDEHQPQLVYALLPKATNTGYATEAATQVLKYCFNELGYDYLVASSDQANLESHKVARKLGMSKVEERIVDGNLITFFRVKRSEVLL